jgi:predicted DNA-binding transcriptional regulator AlpA
MSKQSSPVALIRMQELMRMIDVRSRQTIYDKLREDPTFPKPRREGVHVAWLRSEVVAWIEALPIANLDGLGAVRPRSAAAAPSAATRA